MKRLNQNNQKQIQRANKISSFFKKHFYITIIIDFAILIWFSFLASLFTKSFFGLKVFISIFLIVVKIVYLIIKLPADYKSNGEDLAKKALKTSELYKTLLRSFSGICEKKIHYLAANIKEKSTENVADPISQLNEILTSMQESLAFLLSDDKNRFDTQDMYINLIYSFDEWKNIFHIPFDRSGLKDDLLLSESSFFTYLKGHHSKYLFCNSKDDIHRDNHYVRDERDINTDDDKQIKGSILGYRIRINLNSGDNVNAMLFVSTFDRKFVETEGDLSVVKNNIEKVILKQFELRLKIELCNLYNKNKSDVS